MGNLSKRAPLAKSARRRNRDQAPRICHPDKALQGTMTKNACVIVNPASGKGKARAQPRLDPDRLAQRGVTPIELKSGKDIPAAVKRALEAGHDPIIAAGGDGTICGVAEALAGQGRRLALMPLGTFNYFARSLDIPGEEAAALEVALEGAEQPLSVGEVNGRVFLNNASIGAYAAVLEVRENVYRDWGRSRLAAYWSVIKAMAVLYRSLKMKITVDGEVHHIRSPVAFVAIRAYQLREFELAGAEAVEQGEMALLVARSSGRLGLLWRAIRIFFKGARLNEDYVLYTGKEIDIETSRSNRLVARDGERERMKGPYHFRLRPEALTVKVPPAGERAA